MSPIKIEKTVYAGWANCYRLTNGHVELIVTTDVGPRVIRYGFNGGENLFYECKDQLGKSGEPWWMIRGGHRLWAAPERLPLTYALDNGPAEATVISNDTVAVLQKAPLQKQIAITLSEEGRVEVRHTLANADTEMVEVAPWALTVMAPGGVGMVAFPSRAPHYKQLLPSHPLVMWAYTDFSDKRWTFTKKYLLLKQDSASFDAQKAGLFRQHTFAAFLLGTDLFTKQYEADPIASYTDYGCSCEIFSNPDFLELETLGPLVQLAPGESTSHVERWSLTSNVHLDSFSDSELDRVLLPLMQ